MRIGGTSKTGYSDVWATIARKMKAADADPDAMSAVNI
jgi:hypothetical protein